MKTFNTEEALTRLREQQRKLLAAIRTHLAVTGGDALHALANQHEFTDDDAVADQMAEMDLAMLATELSQLREIQRARERIAKGSYGVCVGCGGPVGQPRLLAYPAAERCIACQTAQEGPAVAARHATL